MIAKGLDMTNAAIGSRIGDLRRGTAKSISVLQNARGSTPCGQCQRPSICDRALRPKATAADPKSSETFASKAMS
jgi:hypothetical protein